MPEQIYQENYFERYARKSKTFITLLFVALGLGVLMMIAGIVGLTTGMVFSVISALEDPESLGLAGYIMLGIMLGTFVITYGAIILEGAIAGLVLLFIFRKRRSDTYAKIQTFLTAGEIAQITERSLFETVLMSKGFGLYQEGAAKNDWTEYNNYVQVLAVNGFGRMVNKLNARGGYTYGHYGQR